MTNSFVQTKNWQRFQDGLRGLNTRGAEECRLVVIDGKPGLGKTTILSRWAVQERCVYLRAKSEWTPYWLLGEILTECQEALPHGQEKRMNAVLATLSRQAQSADMAKRQFAVVIDEADHVAKKASMVELIRDITDLAAVPVILVGMGTIRDQLKRFPQVSSRVSRYVGFRPADVDDVRRFLNERCRVKIADDLVYFVHKATGGYNRELMEAIVSLDEVAMRNPPADPEIGLTLAEMDGRQLINDRATSQPIIVRGAV
ncbi:hypothetical protein AN189_12950 [Loktanella sp. 3ANDIMAR09]|uniref:AAA family ATPase n=1 Tax=Loktanella sp. 3ANDIMAR09 TaxID=1225657 RepID=UPI0006FF8B12|nr:ATP-binding protein [Loktanella sp. 3ANDIMAR09]KQI67979.1 hypothetical protein AN189_12950 [Loktanella sp. 3ANDIMAR09]